MMIFVLKMMAFVIEMMDFGRSWAEIRLDEVRGRCLLSAVYIHAGD